MSQNKISKAFESGCPIFLELKGGWLTDNYTWSWTTQQLKAVSRGPLGDTLGPVHFDVVDPQKSNKIILYPSIMDPLIIKRHSKNLRSPPWFESGFRMNVHINKAWLKILWLYFIIVCETMSFGFFGRACQSHLSADQNAVHSRSS